MLYIYILCILFGSLFIQIAKSDVTTTRFNVYIVNLSIELSSFS